MKGLDEKVRKSQKSYLDKEATSLLREPANPNSVVLSQQPLIESERTTMMMEANLHIDTKYEHGAILNQVQEDMGQHHKFRCMRQLTSMSLFPYW